MKYEIFRECYNLGKALDESWEDGDAFLRACARWGTLIASIRAMHAYDEYTSWCLDCDYDNFNSIDLSNIDA